jgi:hypothetical protein
MQFRVGYCTGSVYVHYTALYYTTVACLKRETAQRSPEAEYFCRTLSCPSWRYGDAIPIGLTTLSREGLAKLACVPLQSFASLVHRPPSHEFVLCFALSTAVGFVVMGADCTNTHANAPSPTQSSDVRINGTYADWYRSRHGKEVDRSLVLPVLKALQVHHEAGAMLEMQTTRSATTSIPYIHTRARYLPRYDRREGCPSMPTGRRHHSRLLRPYCGARLDRRSRLLRPYCGARLDCRQKLLRSLVSRHRGRHC